MRSDVSTSTAALTILTLGGVADPLAPIYDRGLADSPSAHQVDTTAAEGADVNGTRRPSWSVNVRRAVIRMSSGAVVAVSAFQIWTPDTASTTSRLADSANIEINVGQSERAPSGR